jgi:hypothetical protein
VFADRASFYRYAVVLGLVTGVAYAVRYHSSVKIQNFADQAFAGVPLSPSIPHVIRATVCSVLCGFVLTMTFLWLICPITTLAGNDESRFVILRMKMLCTLAFLGDAWLTIDIIRSAYFNE